jgi:hypothetical protein
LPTLDYSSLQSKAKKLIVETFGGLRCRVNYLDNTYVSSYVVLDSSEHGNIDARQNPTTLGGLKRQLAYVPGDLKRRPDVGGTIEYTIGSRTYKKSITSVETLKPTSTALLYTLSLV